VSALPLLFFAAGVHGEGFVGGRSLIFMDKGKLMKSKLAILPLALFATGCTSSAIETRLDGLESDINELRQMISETNNNARDAKSEAASANSAAAEARRLAQRALDATERMAEELASK
jgi:hypothetical protein